MPLVNKKDLSAWKQQFRNLEPEEHATVSARDLKPEGGIKMAEVIKMASDKTEGNSCIVADVGQHQMTAARYYEYKKPHSYVTSGGLGTMGFALPAALGAKMGDPSRDVIAVIGDGCFQMTLQELGTIVQNKIPVKIIILNNSFLGMVRQWQQLFFEKRYSSVALQNPDFVKVADGFGVAGSVVSDPADLEKAIATMLE